MGEIAKLSPGVMKITGLPQKIVVSDKFYTKMRLHHPEIGRSPLFSFVTTVNCPDEIYQFEQKERLNFFRYVRKNTVNIVGTHNKGEGRNSQQIVTSFITTKKNYLIKIKQTTTTVFIKDF